MSDLETAGVLIATNGGVELPLLVPKHLQGSIHLAQSWAPVVCGCGLVHAPADEMALSIFVGPAPPCRVSSRTHLSLAVLPHDTTERDRHYPVVVAHEPRDFGPWAAALIRHLTEALLVPGLIGLDFHDVRELFIRTKHLGFSIAGRVEDLRVGPGTTAFFQIAGSPDLTLWEINEHVQSLADRLQPDADLLMASHIEARRDAALRLSLFAAL